VTGKARFEVGDGDAQIGDWEVVSPFEFPASTLSFPRLSFSFDFSAAEAALQLRHDYTV
jgi:hypothetical protein